jgi:hypothetical protein
MDTTPERASRHGFPFGAHSGTQISLIGFGLLGLSLCLPIWPYFLANYLFILDLLSIEPGRYLYPNVSFSFTLLSTIELIVTCGIVAQLCAASVFFSTLHDLSKKGIPQPRVWRIIAPALPLLGSISFLALWPQPESAPAVEMLIPIFGFLLVLGGTLWQRRLAGQASLGATAASSLPQTLLDNRS